MSEKGALDSSSQLFFISKTFNQSINLSHIYPNLPAPQTQILFRSSVRLFSSDLGFSLGFALMQLDILGVYMKCIRQVSQNCHVGI